MLPVCVLVVSFAFRSIDRLISGGLPIPRSSLHARNRSSPLVCRLDEFKMASLSDSEELISFAERVWAGAEDCSSTRGAVISSWPAKLRLWEDEAKAGKFSGTRAPESEVGRAATVARQRRRSLAEGMAPMPL
ncbi:MAG: hypothetical protein SGPRY_012879 [Prymnesium sp.]